MKIIQELLRKMSFGILSPQPSHPLPTTPDQWKTYWESQGEPWRREPEIDLQRQAELTQKRALVPDIEQGLYPFKGMRLSRADVEWLLVTHDNEKGPVNWSVENQRARKGLDLRGADLKKVNLAGLPLAGLLGGLLWEDWHRATPEQRDGASILLEGANLSRAHLEGAVLVRAHLERVSLREAYLEMADLRSAYLARSSLHGAHLEHANLGAAHLERASFSHAHLAGANLREAHLEGTSLHKAHLEGKKFSSLILPPADLRGAFFDMGSNLEDTNLGDDHFGFVTTADVRWNGMNFTKVKWLQIHFLGDEYLAQQAKDQSGRVKDKATRLSEHEAAMRANRQLAVELQTQGLNEQAARFAYRAQVLQRRVFWFEMIQQNVKLRQRGQTLGAWLFSWFLFLLAGYGYKLGRSFLAYVLVIAGFTALYLGLDGQLTWYEAVVVSMTAFHGRGFSPSTFSPSDPLSIASAFEAFVGLIIEVTFIATLTQRFFNK